MMLHKTKSLLHYFSLKVTCASQSDARVTSMWGPFFISNHYKYIDPERSYTWSTSYFLIFFGILAYHPSYSCKRIAQGLKPFFPQFYVVRVCLGPYARISFLTHVTWDTYETKTYWACDDIHYPFPRYMLY